MKFYSLFSDVENVFDQFGSSESAVVFITIIFLFFVFLFVIAAAFKIVARWIFFRKCGKGGWEAIVPVYNEITLLKTAGMNWWWIFILYSTSVISIIETIMDSYESFGGYSYYTSPIFTFMSIFVSLIAIAASVFVILTRIGEGINISKRFGKSGGYAVLIIFFEPIMLLILGLSKNAKYDENVKVSPNGLFGRVK